MQPSGGMETQQFTQIWTALLPVVSLLAGLLAGAIGAMWTRRAQVSDRKAAFAQQEAEAKRAADARIEESERKAQESKYEEVKSAFADFMAGIVMFEAKHQAYRAESLLDALTPTAERLAVSRFVVSLLGDDEIQSLATDLWNATQELALMDSDAVPADYAGRAEEWGIALDGFERKARAYLATLYPRAGLTRPR